jgi:hypothetical protein
MTLTLQQRIIVSHALTGLSLSQRDDAARLVINALRDKPRFTDDDLQRAIGYALERTLGRAA